MQPGTVTVPLSPLRLLERLLVGNLGVDGALLVIFGPGAMVALACAVAGFVSILFFVIAALRQRPRIVLTPDGFAMHKLFGEESHKWGDIAGQFAVIKIGWSQAVAYNLTADYKLRAGKKPTSLFSGYDAAVSGAFKCSAGELAELLNEHKQRNSSPSSA